MSRKGELSFDFPDLGILEWEDVMGGSYHVGPVHGLKGVIASGMMVFCDGICENATERPVLNEKASS